VHDFLHPDRIVIGCEDPGVAVRVSALYAKVQAPVLVTDCASAEMIKYASNTFLATKVSFINAIANLCEALDADVREVALGMGYDRRIGFDFLRPGPGYGGSCLPKDTAALIRAAEEAGYHFGLLRGVVEVNREQHERVLAKIHRAAGRLDGNRVAVWGLTFKANTDDLRDSPALAVVERLLEEGALVAAYDPVAGARAPAVLAARARREIVLSDVPVAGLASGGGLAARPAGPAGAPGQGGRLPLERLFVASDPYEACRGAAVLAVLTEWDEFRWLDFDRVRQLLAMPAVVDARNLLDPLSLRRRGFRYQGVGR
jgi:UDPglucose 6-dehydrogenase